MKKLIVIASLLLFFISITICFADDLKIEAVSQQQLNHIKSVLDKGLVVGESAAVKSQNHGMAYYVGLNFYATGIKNKM